MPEPEPTPKNDRSPWNWLLFVPVIIPILPFLYNADDPRFLDFPLFYWLQLVFIAVGVATTSTVYLMTKKKGGDDE